MSDDMSSEPRKVLMDANPQCVNAMSGKKLQKLIVDTLDMLETTLLAHCGPDAGLTLMTTAVPKYSKLTIPKLTNDGISIVHGMDFLNPVQQQICQAISYVGERVDQKVHDGTTTAMIFAIELLKHVLSDEFIKNAHGYNKRKLISQVFEQVREEFLDSIYVHTEDRLLKHLEDHPTIMGDVAELVALIASKGDQVLASCIKDIVASRPLELLEDVTFKVSRMETEERYWVEKQEEVYDFALDVALRSDPLYLNTGLGTEYLNDDTQVIISTEPVSPGYPGTEIVLKHVADPKREKVLILVAPHFEARVLEEINKLNEQVEIPAFVFTSPVPPKIKTSMPAHLLVVNLSGKKDSPRSPFPDEYLHDHIAVKFKRDRLYLTGIYADDESKESLYNPRYAQNDWDPYNTFVTQLKQLIDLNRGSHTPDMDLIDYWQSVYSQALCRKELPTLWIGGTSTTAQTNIAVVQDAMGSVVSAIRKGVVVNGLNVMYTTCIELFREKEASLGDEDETTVVMKFVKVFSDTARKISKTVLSSAGGTVFSSPDQVVEQYVDDDGLTRYSKVGTLNIPVTNPVTTIKPVVQPLDGYLEMLHRIEEICINFVGLHQVQMSGAVLVDSSTKETS